MVKLLSMLKGQQKKTIRQDVVNQNKHIYLALGYLSGNCFRQDFHIRDVSNAIGLNEEYLRKLFLQEVHLSMRDYVTNARITRAKELLRYSNYNVSEVAGFVGYRDYWQFHAIFKKKKRTWMLSSIPVLDYFTRYRRLRSTGMAPSDYQVKLSASADFPCVPLLPRLFRAPLYSPYSSKNGPAEIVPWRFLPV